MSRAQFPSQWWHVVWLSIWWRTLLPGARGLGSQFSQNVWNMIRSKGQQGTRKTCMVWRELTNANWSELHQLDDFYITQNFRTMASYIHDLHMCLMLPDFTTTQQMKVAIAVGCSISPILSITMFEVILIRARQVFRKFPTILYTNVNIWFN